MSENKVLFHLMDAADLFCSIIKQYEINKIASAKEKNLVFKSIPTSIGSMDYLMQALKIYAKGHQAPLDVGKAIFKYKTHKFQVFAKKILIKEPVAVKEDEVRSFLEFINYDDESISHFLKYKTRSLSEWKINLKEDTIEDTKWWIYFYDKSDLKIGITRSLLLIKKLGKATIINYQTLGKKIEIYEGKYSIFDHVFLKLEMKLGSAQEKNLQITANIGTGDDINFALGLYSNVHSKIYAGSIILKKLSKNEGINLGIEKTLEIKDESEKNKKLLEVVEFFGGSENDNEKISKSIKNFFEKATNNFIEIDNEILCEDDIDNKKTNKRGKTKK